MKRFYGICLPALCLLCATRHAPLHAQRLDSVQHLKQVEIRAAQTRSKNLRAVTPVQVISQRELKRLEPHTAGDAVKQFAGVQVKDYGGVGGMKTVSVRSLGAAHTAVSYDGVLLSDAQNGQIDLGKIYVDQVNSVVLHNGQSGDLLQGARNFSAASLLQLSTGGLAGLDSAGRYSIGLDAGSFLNFSPSFYAGKRLSAHWGVSASARFDYVKGNYSFYKDLGGTVVKLRRQNSDVRAGNAEFNAYYFSGGKHNLDMKFCYYGSERGLPGAVIDYYPHSAQRLTDQSFFAVLKHTWQISPAFTQRNAVKYNFLYNRFLDPESLSSGGVEDNRYLENEVYLSTATVYNTPVKGLEFSLALDAAFTALQSNMDYFAFPFRTGLWLNAAGKYSHRYVEVAANGLMSAYFDRVQYGAQPADKIRVSPFASVAVFPLGNRIWSVRAFYKDIFRMPTFNDLYYVRMGNTGLKPEKAKQINAGTVLSLPASASGKGRLVSEAEISADYYKNWVEDKIVAYPTSNLFIWNMLNLGRVEIDGIDVSARFSCRFGRSGLARKFGLNVSGSYTFQRSLDKTNKNNGTYNHQVAYTPVHSAAGTAGFEFPYGELVYRFFYSGERYALNENIAQNRLAPYTEHSLGLNFHIPLKNRTAIEWGVDWINFTGTRYEVVLNYPMPLQHGRLRVKIVF